MATLAGTAHAADLTIEVGGVDSGDGKVVVSIYKSSDSFLKKPLASVSVAALKQGVKAVFSNLEPGDYAASAYHDENDNGKLDTNMLGIPKEPTGASNNAQGKLGPPKYEQAKFNLAAADMAINFQLRR